MDGFQSSSDEGEAIIDIVTKQNVVAARSNEPVNQGGIAGKFRGLAANSKIK
jgi:hypothetical protein